MLQYELKTQNEISEKLNETLIQTRNELKEHSLKENNYSIKMSEDGKKIDINYLEIREKNKELNKNLEDLKQDRSIYNDSIFKLRNISEEIKKNNKEKADVLKTIKNYYLTNIFKIKNLSELEIEYKKK